jgi:subtilase family serine protease
MAEMVEIPGSERAEMVGSERVGPVPDDEIVQATIAVRQRPSGARRAAQIAELAPSQRPHLTDQEFSEIYAADQSDVDRVVDVARSAGLQVLEASAETRSVRVSGTAKQFRDLFGVTLQRYRVGNKTFRGRTGPLKVPASVADVIEGVFGIDNRPVARRHRAAPVGVVRASNPTSLTALQVAKAYNFPTADGSGETIAIIEFGGGYRTIDLQDFFTGLGLPVPAVASVGVDGGTNSPVDAPVVTPGTPAAGAPSVTDVSPRDGDPGGGDQVVVSGSGFTGATAVMFGAVPATINSVDSDSQITVTSPAATETVDVAVVNPSGTPTVSSLTPANGPPNGQTQVAVTGTGFTGAIDAVFGNVASGTVVVSSDSQMQATSPPVSMGVHVTVTAPGGTSAATAADYFIYNDSDGEVTLDIEVAGAVAPKANFVVYFAPNSSDGWRDVLQRVVADTTNNPSILSISWGGPEDLAWTAQQIAVMENLFVQASTKKIAVFAASGDNGAADLSPQAAASNPGPHCDYPASSPNVTGCGGSTLTLSAGARASEVVWNDPDPADPTGVDSGTSGGGVSVVFPNVPPWQSGASVPTNPKGGPGRGVPDVCGHATAYQVVLRGVVTDIGGTSAVAPLWSGLAALVNQRLGRRFGPLLDVLYGSSVAATFFDITSGTNGAYNAGPGWDPCTGLGSPDGTKLLQALAGGALPVVNGVSPATGPAAGQTSVTITGTGFTGAISVGFGVTGAPQMTVDSDAQITVTSPAGSGTVDITVVTAAGISAVVAVDRFSYT